MLAKKFRIPIQSVLNKGGKIIRAPFFLIKIFPNNLPHSRFGVIVSKKVAKEATARNKLKRIIFSGISSEVQKVLSAPPASRPAGAEGEDFLIIINPSIKNFSKEEITVQLQKILNKIF